MSFLDSLDVANFACHLLGVPKIQSPTEDSKQNTSMSFAFDKVREAELRRNTWRFSIKRAVLRAVDANTRLLDPQPWNVSTLYLPGAIVKDGNGDLWSSDEPENVGEEPGVSSAWDQYFGPVSVSLYDSTVTYYAGELAYVLVGSGGFVVFRSLANGNTDTPTTTTAWDATVTYNLNQVVSYLGSNWRSIIPLNFNVTPADAPNAFDLAVTYTTAQTVVGSDGYIYSSVGTGNVGHDPVTDAGVHWTNTAVPAAWDRTPATYSSSELWLPVYAGLKRLVMPYPVGGSPSSIGGSAITVFKNAFRLPANWLREAAQEPKQGSYSVLGAPSGAPYNDWEYEGDFLLSSLAGPILYRFAADVTVVSEMDSMFCIGLAARMAEDTCEDLTQQTDKLSVAVSRYKQVMGEARTVNAIEQGPTEPPEDDYLAARY